ncbi:hypothetical protein [Streptomyces olivaceoviridis]|uniref:hypothetical protein n=1 Tax=Streptomyces olivaceoviridis TaxID=1921 RepID=UPI0036F5B64C
MNLVAYSADDGPTSSVILTGAIGDYGSAVSVTPGGAVDPDHRGDLQLRLTRSSFRIHTADIDKQLVTAFATFPPNRTTCSGTVVAAGPAPVVRNSGTGSYRGLTGTFRLTITIAEVDARHHCTPSSAFLKGRRHGRARIGLARPGPQRPPTLIDRNLTQSLATLDERLVLSR